MWIGYMSPEDEAAQIDADPMTEDDAIEEYIERRRAEFYKEWFRYLDENL